MPERSTAYALKDPIDPYGGNAGGRTRDQLATPVGRTPCVASDCRVAHHVDRAFRHVHKPVNRNPRAGVDRNLRATIYVVRGQHDLDDKQRCPGVLAGGGLLLENGQGGLSNRVRWDFDRRMCLDPSNRDLQMPKQTHDDGRIGRASSLCADEFPPNQLYGPSPTAHKAAILLDIHRSSEEGECAHPKHLDAALLRSHEI